MTERRFSVQIELKLYDFAVPEGFEVFPVPIWGEDGDAQNLKLIGQIQSKSHFPELRQFRQVTCVN